MGMNEGVSIIEINKKLNPTERAFYYDGGTPLSIITSEGNKLLIADGLDGIEILRTNFQFETKNNTLLYIILTTAVVSTVVILIIAIIYKKKLAKKAN